MKSSAITTAALMTLLAGATPVVSAAPAASTKSTSAQASVERKQVWISGRAKDWNTEHRTWVQRGGYTAYRVPDDQYTMYFGPEHTFRVNALPYKRFNAEDRYQYNGHWMTVVDPWPESWQEGWWDNDDVYIRYDDGYYLYNTRYPDTGLAISFSN